jgi:glutathione S-transferase
MEARLYMLPASHPCFAVKRALELKGIPFRRIDLPPPFHRVVQRVMFGGLTVPGLALEGERLQGSRRIMARLDELAPSPRLYPEDDADRARVEEADRWGEEVLQTIPRHVTTWALRRDPSALPSYTEGWTLPVPPAVVNATAPGTAWIQARLNGSTDSAIRADLEALPGHLDRVDGWLEEGLLGGDEPNAADFQILSSVRLLTTLGDLQPLLEPRPARTAAGLFPVYPGSTPAGLIPADWMPRVPTAAAAA